MNDLEKWKHKNPLWYLILKYPEKLWDWRTISENPNITWDIIQENQTKPWNWDWISCNPNITWDIIQENPTKPWDWGLISRNPNITWDIIQSNPTKPWNWDWISRNPNITWDIIQANPTKPWNWRCISMNPNITGISMNPNITGTWDNIKAYNDMGWDEITWNLTISQEFPDEWINNDPVVTKLRKLRKLRKWYAISENPNITLKFIEANSDKIRFRNLSKNKFTFVRKKNQQKQFKLVLFTLQNFLPQQLQRTIVMDYFYQEIK